MTIASNSKRTHAATAQRYLKPVTRCIHEHTHIHLKQYTLAESAGRTFCFSLNVSTTFGADDVNSISTFEQCHGNSKSPTVLGNHQRIIKCGNTLTENIPELFFLSIPVTVDVQ